MPTKKPESDRKSYALKIRLTHEESQEFEKYCYQQGTTRSRLGRKIVREIVQKQPDLISDEMKEFKQAVRQLAGISRNLNQLTRAANSGQFPSKLDSEAYWADLKTYVGQVRHQLDSVIDATENRWVKR